MSNGTFEDLFGGSKSTGSSAWVKPGEVGETLLMVQVGAPRRKAQQIKVGNQFQDKWLVQVADGDRYKPMGADQFNESEVENAFEPDYAIHLPVKVVARKLADGTKDETFEPYDATWDLSAGDQTDKFKDAMLEAGVPAVEGTKYTRKILSKDKPYKYAIRMQAGE